MASNIRQRDLIDLKDWLGNRSVVLVGLMGAGKSSIGRRLAQRINLPFFDADSEIETAAGKTIAEIFADHGEADFREGERKVIARLLHQGPQILATGGGAYMNDETRQSINDHGVSLWLRAEFPLLMKRVRRRSTRPLLQTPDPEGTMQQLIGERYPVYELADITVESRDVSHSRMVQVVLRAVLAHAGIKDNMVREEVTDEKAGNE